MRFCTVRSCCVLLLALFATGCGSSAATPSASPSATTSAAAKPDEKTRPDKPPAESPPPAKVDLAAAEKDAVAKLKKLEAAMETNDQGQVVSVRLPEGAVPGGFERLTDLPALRELTLSGTGLTDEQLERLPALSSLEKLDLSWTQVTGAGLKHFSGFKQLKELNLAYTQFADSQLGDLATLAHLKAVLLEGTDVSDAGVEQLRKALPGAEITTQAVIAAEPAKPAEKEPAGKRKKHRQLDPDSPAGKFAEIDDDYQEALKNLSRQFGQARNDEARLKVLREFPGSAELAGRMLKLAEGTDDERLAAEALVWIMRAEGGGAGLDETQDRAVQLLIEKHLENQLVERLVAQLNSYVALPQEKLLRAATEKCQTAEMRGLATYNLAHSLAGLVEEISLSADADELTKARMALLHGSEFFERDAKREPEKLRTEAVALLGQVKENYADVTVSRQGSLGELADAELYELQHLSLGCEAPAIEGQDAEGVAFTLSDYRGKVVVLDFFAGWCQPCMAMVPEERALVERLSGKPFAFLGVNVDDTREELNAVVRREKITWRCWWDGSGGPIAEQWKVKGFPTIYVIDGDGKIRFKSLGAGPYERTVERLLDEMAR